MTEEEYFRKNYPDSCYGDRLLSPHWDFFQDGVEFGERQSEKKIADLEKENAELKEQNRNYEQLLDTGSVTLMKERLKSYKQLTKAKNLLNEFMRISKASDEDFEHDYSELIAEAEAFLKE